MQQLNEILSPDQIQSIKDELTSILAERIDKTESEISDLKIKYDKVQLDIDNSASVSSRSNYYDRRSDISKKINFSNNLLIAFKNGGSLASFTDQKGFIHNEIPSFINIRTDKIEFDEDTILTDPVPVFIPYIAEDKFALKGYVFDAMRMAPDQYLLACNSYYEFKPSRSYSTMNPIQAEDYDSGFIFVTLDQLVLISDYYYTKAKAINEKKAKESNQRAEDAYDALSLEKRERFLNQKNFYNAIPAVAKKKYTQSEYEALSTEEKEKIYKPFKKAGAKRLVSKLKDNQMWSSFHDMYERFVNKSARRVVVNKKTQAQRILSEGEKRSHSYDEQVFGNPEVFAYWHEFAEMMEYKLIDIKIQREQLSESYKLAVETSFGDSNTNDSLRNDYGIFVKRQNGSVINPIEIEQIRKAWVNVQYVFGGISQYSFDDKLKISHTASTNVFASKAVGMWVPSMRAIAVSAKLGNEMFECILSHEVAHYIDNTLGRINNGRYITDNFESPAGKLARAFRKNTNKKPDTDYLKATKECFARCMEQFFAVSIYGENALNYNADKQGNTKYFTSDNYASKQSYDTVIKPLIDNFLESEKGFFKYLIPVISNTDMEEIENIKPEEITSSELSVLPKDKPFRITFEAFHDGSGDWRAADVDYDKDGFAYILRMHESDGFKFERMGEKKLLKLISSGEYKADFSVDIDHFVHGSKKEMIQAILGNKEVYFIPHIKEILSGFAYSGYFDNIIVINGYKKEETDYWRTLDGYLLEKGNFQIGIYPKKSSVDIFLFEPGMDSGNVPTSGQIQSWFADEPIELNQYLQEAKLLLEKEIEKTFERCLERNGISTEHEDHFFGISTVVTTSSGIRYKVNSINGDKVNLIKDKSFEGEQDHSFDVTFNEFIEQFRLGDIKVQGFQPGETREFARVLKTILLCHRISVLKKGSADAMYVQKQLEEMKAEKERKENEEIISAEDLIEINKELEPYIKEAERLYKKHKGDIKEAASDFIKFGREEGKLKALSTQAQNYFGRKYYFDERGNMTSMNKAAEDFILDCVREHKNIQELIEVLSELNQSEDIKELIEVLKEL